MAYREPSEQAPETDPEATAVAALRTRASRVRTAIHVPLLLGGIAGGAVLYVVLRELQFALNGAHMPWLTGLLAFVPTFGGSFWLAPRLADAVVRKALPRWRAALAKEHGLDLAELEETTRLLE
jgi:hypothetical protein